MNKVRTIVICDTGPVLHLDELECLHLPNDFQQVILPKAVIRELKRLRPAILKNQIVSFEVAPRSLPINYGLLTLCKVFSLHTGEIETLSLMERMPDAIFLTDDSAARLVAQKMRYKVHGTIGILIRAIRRKIMNPQEVVDILQTIPKASSLHIKPELLEDIIVQIRKEFNL